MLCVSVTGTCLFLHNGKEGKHWVHMRKIIILKSVNTDRKKSIYIIAIMRNVFPLVKNRRKWVFFFLDVFMFLTSCAHFDSVMHFWWDNCVKPHLILTPILCCWNGTCGSLFGSIMWWAEPVIINPGIRRGRGLSVWVCASARPQQQWVTCKTWRASAEDHSRGSCLGMCSGFIYTKNVVTLHQSCMMDKLDSVCMRVCVRVEDKTHLCQTHLCRRTLMRTVQPSDASESGLHSGVWLFLTSSLCVY